MTYRFPLFLLAVAVAVFVATPLLADKAEKETHEGTFVKANSATEFVMADKEKKEHTHTLGTGAKVFGTDGKECKLSDLKKGQKIRVTTKKGDAKTALKVEALKD